MGRLREVKDAAGSFFSLAGDGDVANHHNSYPVVHAVCQRADFDDVLRLGEK